MYQPAIQYRPRIRNVRGIPTYEPARYRRLGQFFHSLSDAAEAAISFHSQFIHKHVTVPVVVTGRAADGSFRFEFARHHSHTTDTSF